jgi:hypothetical protein
VVQKKIRLTNLLFEGREGLSFNECLLKIHAKPNLLVLLKLRDGNMIGAFSEQPLAREKWKGSGKGFLMSVTNMKKFNILKKNEGEIIPFYNNKFIMGNDELIIFLHNMTYSVIFGTVPCYFDTRFKDVKDFIGSED